MAKSSGSPRLFYVPSVEAKSERIGRVRFGRSASRDSPPSRDDRRNDESARRPSDSEVEQFGVFRRTRRRRSGFASASQSGNRRRLRPKRKSIFRRKRFRVQRLAERRFFRRRVESSTRKSETKKKILRQIRHNLSTPFAPLPFAVGFCSPSPAALSSYFTPTVDFATPIRSTQTLPPASTVPSPLTVSFAATVDSPSFPVLS